VEAAGNSLAERIGRGDAAAIAEAYDLHAEAVFAFARRLVGDDAAAEDLVHEVFITLRSVARRFGGASSLRTFLISIAVNHARHHVRAASRRRAAMARFARERHEGDGSGTPEHDAIRVDLARELTEALDALPIEQRVAFVLCEVEERSAREAAEIVGAPEATVRTRVFHAKRKLRDELARRGHQ
jgi:RNA polymerase sigma-70 factor (ECF subfamily)